MFHNFSNRPIDPVLKNIVAEIEKNPRLSVLAARQFHYACQQTPIEITISQSRRFNVIEEFIFRAGVDLNPPATEDDLADIFGLAPVFINSTAASLRKIKTLEVVADSTIQITDLGREYYRQQQLPDSEGSRTVKIYTLFDPLINRLKLQNECLTSAKVDKLVNLANFVQIENNDINLDNSSLLEFIALLQTENLTHHRPEDSTIVSDFRVADNHEIIWISLPIFVIFDFEANEISIQAGKGTEKLEESNCLNNLINLNKVSLEALCQLTDEEVKENCRQIHEHKNEENEKRIAAIKAEALRELTQPISETDNSSNGTVVLLRDATISSEFDKLLDSAIHQVLIYSPWVSRTIINDRFINRLQKLADKGLWILIGHGIAKNITEEDRRIPSDVEDNLRSILSPERIPVVQVVWLGGSHAKEVIADRKVHILGSNNLLSCRASSGLWAESAYKVTIPKQVHDAYEYNARRFRVKAQELWNQATQKKDVELAKQAIYLWGALEMEGEILLNIQSSDLLVLELYTIWIKVVMQGLRSRRISINAKCCKDIEQWFNQNSNSNLNINLLRSKWELIIS